MTDNVACLRGTHDVVKVKYEAKMGNSGSPTKCEVFEVFFFLNDDDQSVWVMETPKIDLGEIISCLKQGHSVFIYCKKGLE